MTSPDCRVWVAVDAIDGDVPAAAGLEALTPALALARAWGGGVRIVLFAASDVPPAHIDMFVRSGATSVTVLRNAGFGQPETPARVDALDALLRTTTPHALLVVADAAAAWWPVCLAGRRALPIATRCIDVTAARDRVTVRRETLNGAFHASQQFTVQGPLPIVLGLATGSWNAPAPMETASGAMDVIAIDSAPAAVQRLRHIASAPGDANLEDAELVVAGGAGLGNAAAFATLRELAQLLGAAVGASRVAVDAGWARPEQQVGLTGRRVGALVYLAFGMSGSREHMVGVADVRSIVAVNTDASAPIARVSRVVAVADARALLRSLVSEAQRRGARVRDVEPAGRV